MSVGARWRSPRDLCRVSKLAAASLPTMAAMPPTVAPAFPDTTDPAHYALGRSDAEARRLILQHRI